MARTLPDNFRVRTPGPADFRAVVALVNACHAAESSTVPYTFADLRSLWRSASVDLERDAWVVEAWDGSLAAVATLWDLGPAQLTMSGYVRPDCCGQGIGAHLLALKEARAYERAANAPVAGRVALRTWVSAVNMGARELLAERGYAPVRYFYRMLIELDRAPEPGALPRGIALRPLARGRDERVLHTAFEEAFAEHWGHGRLSFEEWSAYHFARDDFDPGLYLLAMDGNEIAGFALCRDYGDRGLVDELGVRAPWRRRGLGEALLRTAFGAFWARGQRLVTLGVDAANAAGALRLYERADMRRDYERVVYEKTLREGSARG